MTTLNRILHAGPAATWTLILCLVLTTSLRAQERVRTVEQPRIQSYVRTPEAFFYFGPFEEELTGNVAVEYTDNVNLAATNKISDLSFSQGLSLNTTWVISHLNKLEFNFGGEVREHFYGNGRSQVNLAISPNSMVEFKFAVSDLQVRLYDQFSYAQNPTSDPTATNTANLNSLTNTFGAVVDADLNIAILSLAADYTYNTQSGENAAGQNNPTTSGTRQTFRFGPKLTFQLSPDILYGISADATRSNAIHEGNVNSLSLGPFINGKLTREFEFDLAAGATLVDAKPAIAPNYYLSAAIRYRINRHWQLLMSGSHELIFTTGTDLTEQNVFQVGTQLDLTRYISLNLAPFVNFGDVKSNNQGTVNAAANTGSYTQFGIEATLAWKPRRRWTTALTYGYIRRESGNSAVQTNEFSNSYIQNTITFSISYAF